MLRCVVRAATQIVQKAADLQEAISEGATSFLLTEYKYMGVFMVCFQPLSDKCICRNDRAMLLPASTLLLLMACCKACPFCTS